MGMPQTFIRYGNIFYDPKQQLLKRQDGKELKLRPKSLQVFLLLAENAGELVSKDDIINTVWNDVFVTEDSLIQCIADIRRILQDKQRDILKTVPRKGYIFFPPQSASVSEHTSTTSSNSLLPFIGRQQELSELENLLQTPECRLLVILGLGGVGKSCLAHALQKRLQASGQYRDGVHFVSLANLQKPEFIPGAIATQLGISTQGIRPPTMILAEALGDKNMLVILDNIEHLLTDLSCCLKFLETCPELNILMTSRLPVELEGKWLYQLQGFPLPDNATDFTQSAAYQLFVHTAQRIRHDFKPEKNDPAYILEICRLVGGMPLGIEIAARWIQHLSCAEIVAEMRRYLLGEQDNSTANKETQETQNDLANVLQQSWAMLSEREQAIMQTLALFRGNFTREAATAVAGAGLDDFSGLIGKSMLSRNTDGRYVLHEVMRRYASERRTLSGIQQHANQSFFDYHLEFARSADNDILGSQQLNNIVQLETEHPNLRECLTLCNPNPDNKLPAPLAPKLGMGMVGSLGMFWFLANHWKEGRNWAVHFLNINQSERPTQNKAAAFLTAGGLSVLLDDYALANSHLKTATEMAEHVNSDILSARCHTILGVLRRLQGAYPQAISNARRSMALFDTANDQGGYQFNLGNMGHSLVMSGLYDEAVEALEQCIRLNQQIGPTMSMPYALVNLGRLHWKLQQADAARIYLQRALEVTDKIGILLYRAQALCTLGWIDVCHDELTQAQEHFQHSADTYLRLGDREGLADAMKGIAVVKARRDELKPALQFMTVADVLIEDFKVPVSTDHADLLRDAQRCIKHGMKPEVQQIYRNLALTASPEELLQGV